MRLRIGVGAAEERLRALARELLNLVGLNINWVVEPVANCQRTGNHMNVPPHTFKDSVEFLCEEAEEATGVKIEPSINRKGATLGWSGRVGTMRANPNGAARSQSLRSGQR